MLLEYEANININNADGNSPLALACGAGNFQLVEAILAHPSFQAGQAVHSSCDPMFAAIDNEREYIVHRLLQNGFSVNQTTPDGSTPLYEAAHWNIVSIVKLLIRHVKNTNRDAVVGALSNSSLITQL